jgi:hypothetical protein
VKKVRHRKTNTTFTFICRKLNDDFVEQNRIVIPFTTWKDRGNKRMERSSIRGIKT